MPATQHRYEVALATFNSDLRARGLSMFDLSEDELDWVLADTVLRMYEATECVEGLARAAVLVAAVSKALPRTTLKCSLKMLDVWRRRHPPQQAGAFPAEVALALITWTLLAGQPGVSACLLLCWGGLLRCSEALALRWSALVRTGSTWVAILGHTKRGMDQKVCIDEPSLCRWLHVYHQLHGRDTDERVCGVSYSRVSYWLRKGAAALQLGEGRWTSHGFRRGSASTMFGMGMAMQDVMQKGRWQSERSAREYIRRGDVNIMKHRLSLHPAQWQRVTQLAQLSWQAFHARASQDS